MKTRLSIDTHFETYRAIIARTKNFISDDDFIVHRGYINNPANLHFFCSMLGGFQTFDLLLEKTNKRIRYSWNYVEKGNPPSRRFGGRPEGRQSSEMLPGG
jgi:hypothetical protein